MITHFLLYKKQTILSVLFLLIISIINAQEVKVQYTFADSSNARKNEILLKKSFPDKENTEKYISDLVYLLSSNGFISASVDDIKKDSFQYNVLVFLGEKYYWNQLYIPDSLKSLAHKLGYEEKDFMNKPYNKVFADNFFQKIIDYYGSLGFPFAKAGMNNIKMEGSKISGDLYVDKGHVYLLDSIILVGDANISLYYLQNILEIKPHEPYNSTKLAAIDNKLQNLSFVKQTHPWELKMTSEGALLYLYLDKNAVNEIDAIIGFNSGDNTLEKKLNLNGQVRINLRNAFGAGESIGINWEQLRAQSPRLNLAFSKSYIFHSPFGTDIGFNMYKYDSAFVNIHGYGGMSYALSANQQMKFLLNASSSRLLNVDTNLVIITKQLPSKMDMAWLSGELSYRIIHTDYIFNPRKGFEFDLSLAGGKRSIKKNNMILQIIDPSFDYKTLYDTVQAKVYQMKGRLYATKYFPFGKQAVFKTGISAGIMYSPSYYLNELFQIGGYKLLRGFNEESIFANQFGVGTIEYRYLFAQNSFFFVFVDGGWRKMNVSTQKLTNTYISAGAGMAFQTKAGIFNLILANGKASEETFKLNQMKVHVGYTALF